MAMHQWNQLQIIKVRLPGRLRDERGQALVEFALVLPVLIAIILGIIYYGRYMDYQNQETQLAGEGARWAAVDYNPPGAALLPAYIKSQAQQELQFGSSDVSVPLAVYIYYPTNNPTPLNAVGNSVRVCVVATVKIPAILFVAPITAVMARTATMRIETVADANSFTADLPATVPSACGPTSS